MRFRIRQQIPPEGDDGQNATDRDVVNLKLVILVCLLVFTGMYVLTSPPTLANSDTSYFPVYASDMNDPTRGKKDLISMEPLKGFDAGAIFFLDTSNNTELSDMTLCSIESAGALNPNSTIYLIRNEGNLRYNAQLTAVRAKVPNLVVRRVHSDTFLLEANMRRLAKIFRKSKWLAFHMSDIFRTAVMYKYGGTYLDSDAVSIRPLPTDKNFVVVEGDSGQSIASGVLRLQRGHPVLRDVKRQLDEDFDPEGWATNGPIMFAKAIRKICHIPASESLSTLKPPDCAGGVVAYPKEKFLLIGTKSFLDFVRPLSGDEIESKIAELEDKSFSTHLWGHRYRMHGIQFDFAKFNSSQLIYHIGRKFCPATFKASLESASASTKQKEQSKLLIGPYSVYLAKGW